MAAKHIVKCMVCGEMFDANIEPYIKPNSNRYAHEKCYLEKQEKEEKEAQERNQMEEYIIKLLHIDFIYPAIKAQLKQYLNTYHYTYNGIYKTLKYCYEIKNMDISKADGRIGIVPYYYNEAQAYFLNLFEKNTQKLLNKPESIEIIIPIPQRKLKKRKVFTFLDEEVE